MNQVEGSPTILVLGPTGQVGWELVRCLAPLGRVVGLGRPALDFLRPETVRKALRDTRPTLVWNAVADTAVDLIETREAEAWQVNADTPGILAEEARRAGAMLVHFSTDYVFDGRKRESYAEEDPPNPLNAYGRTKLAGERMIQQVGGQFLILRTSWVYSEHRRNFLRTIVSAGRTAGHVQVVDDQIGAPTWAHHLGRVCANIGHRLVGAETGEDQELCGLYHLTAGGSTSWFGFAREIRDALVARGFQWQAVLDPVSTGGRKQVPRPLNSVLSNRKINQVLGVSLPDWSVGLQEFLDDPVRRSILWNPGGQPACP